MRGFIAAAICGLLISTPVQARTRAILPAAEATLCPPSTGDLHLRYRAFADGMGAIERRPGLYYIDYTPGVREYWRIGRNVAVIRFDHIHLGGDAINVRVKGYIVQSPYELDEYNAKALPKDVQAKLSQVMVAMTAEFPCQ